MLAEFEAAVFFCQEALDFNVPHVVVSIFEWNLTATLVLLRNARELVIPGLLKNGRAPNEPMPIEDYIVLDFSRPLFSPTCAGCDHADILNRI